MRVASTPETLEPARHNPGHKLFALLLGLSAAAFWKPLWTLGQFAFQSEQYSHILLIPIVSLVLLYQERDRFLVGARRDWASGGVVIALGVLLHLFYLRLEVEGRWSLNDRMSLAIFSVVLVWLGLFLLCYGREVFRAILFPLGFLFLMVPIPEAALTASIRALQLASGEATAILFRVSGIPVYREGLVFTLPRVTIEVAKECSGIRSSLALFITSLLAAHLFLRTWSRKAVLWLAVLPITIFKNGLRIVTLSLLAIYVDPNILDSTAHRRGGIPFFGLALISLGAVLWLLQRTERSPLPQTQASPEGQQEIRAGRQ